MQTQTATRPAPRSYPIWSYFGSELGTLILIATALAVLHVATNGHYGFHRDELQTLDDARHLDWGYVVYPPITPLIGRLELALFGTSLIGFRFFAAIAVAVVALLTGLIAKELGGSRHSQVLAAVAAATAPISLVQGAVFQYVSFDYLWGVLATYFLVRLLKATGLQSNALQSNALQSHALKSNAVKSNAPRWWLAVGAVLGLGMETRYTIGVLALGIAVAVVLTPARRYLRSPWLWAGVAASILIFLPNVIWQARHHFISREFLTYLHTRDLSQGRYDGFYIEQLVVCVNLVTAPLVLLGLWFYLRRPEGRPYRLLGWTFVVSFAIFAVVKSRSYYTAPLYPMLLAAGSVMLGIWLEQRRPWSRRLVYAALWTATAINGVLAALLFLPVAPVGSAIWRVTAKVYDQFREEIGWQDLARAVAGVYHSLPKEEQQRTGIFAGNYGEAGALNLYGPGLGLPHAMALTNSFYDRGYDPRQPQTVILTGVDLEDVQKLFASCEVAAKNGNPYGVENEESVYHPDILLCRNLRMSWPELWESHRQFG